jgi:hypothetical protein
MCSAPVSTITELLPSTPAIGELPAADGATSAGAVKTVFTASGSLTMRNVRVLEPIPNVTLNVSPKRSAQ